MACYVTLVMGRRVSVWAWAEADGSSMHASCVCGAPQWEHSSNDASPKHLYLPKGVTSCHAKMTAKHCFCLNTPSLKKSQSYTHLGRVQVKKESLGWPTYFSFIHKKELKNSTSYRLCTQTCSKIWCTPFAQKKKTLNWRTVSSITNSTEKV